MSIDQGVELPRVRLMACPYCGWVATVAAGTLCIGMGGWHRDRPAAMSEDVRSNDLEGVEG